MQHDDITVEILADGRVKVSTDQISAGNHLSADQLLSFLARLLGGETQSHPKAHAHRHTPRGREASH
jgi:hypothetical protein